MPSILFLYEKNMLYLSYVMRDIMEHKIWYLKTKAVGVYMMLMCSFYLFYFHRYYFDITESKYYFFQFSTLILIGVMIFLFIFEKMKVHGKGYLLRLIYQKMTLMDKFFFLFMLGHIISTICSPYQKESFSGAEGRLMGLSFYILIAFSYYYISRYFKDYKLVIHTLLICSSLVYILAILNYFYIDPFGFGISLTRLQIHSFYSTIGNMNFLCSLVCMSVAITCILYIRSKGLKASVYYHIILCIGFGCLLIANSDSGYLGLGIFLSVLFIYSSNHLGRFQKTLYIILNFLTTVKIINIIQSIFVDNRGLDSISNFFAGSNISSAMLIAVLIICLIIKIMEKKAIKLIKGNTARIFIASIFILIISSAFCSFIWFSIIDRTTDLGELENYLRFSKTWGSSRGMIWEAGADAFSQMSWKMKLFGSGCDTFKPLFQDIYINQFTDWDNVHNEFLQYLITGGIFTFISYIGLLVSCFYQYYKDNYKSIWQFCILGGIFTYAVQSIVNIAQPLTTPLFFLLLAMSQSFIRKQIN